MIQSLGDHDAGDDRAPQFRKEQRVAFVWSGMDQGESYEEARNYDLALGIREPHDHNSASKGASVGRFGRLLQQAGRLVSKYGEPATGPDLRASARDNQAP